MATDGNGRISLSEDTLRRVLAEFKLELVRDLAQYARAETVTALEQRVSTVERNGSFGTREELTDHERRLRLMETSAAMSGERAGALLDQDRRVSRLESAQWQFRGALALVVVLIPILIAISWRVWA